RVGEPRARGRSAEEVPVAREQPPYRARVPLARRAVEAGYADGFQGDALAVQHPEDVMVRNDEERRRVGERLVVGEPGGVRVAVRTDDGERSHTPVEAASDRALARVGRQQAILGQ